MATAILYFGIMNLNPQFRTVRYSRRRYPKVWQAVKALRDPAKGEVFSEYLPVLNVEGRRLFYVSYHPVANKQFLEPTSIVLLDDAGRVIANDQLFAKAHVAYNLGIFTLSPSQTQLNEIRRSVKKLLRQDIPQIIRSLERNRRRFEEIGLAQQLKRTLAHLDIFKQAWQEVDRFLTAREAYIRAAGYGFVSEFSYEDGERFRQLSAAFAHKLETEFGQPMLAMSLGGALLLDGFERHANGWRERGTLKRSLEMIVHGREALRTYDVYAKEAQVPTKTWENYHQKLEALRSRGVPVVNG